MDVLLAILLIVIFSPALLIIALGIVLDSRGPVFFRQERYGKDKKVFRVFKFRTMCVAESAGTFTQARRGDPRLTRLGWLLRHTSLDELPQLLNVVKGDMSLVGPRPHAVPMDDVFGTILPGYSDRHLSGQELPAWRRCAATEVPPKQPQPFTRGSATIETTFNVGRSGSTLKSWPALHLRSSTKMRCEQGYGHNGYVALSLQCVWTI